LFSAVFHLAIIAVEDHKKDTPSLMTSNIGTKENNYFNNHAKF